MSFGAETTTDEVLQGVDLSGQRALVTGASSGLGEETARALASKGAAVTMAVRDLAKGEAAAARIRASTGGDLEVARLDLSVPGSVRAFAGGWLDRHRELNLLINNAGIMACPLMRTAEGWEMQFATNHLGHFLLTNLLMPALKAGAPARIVNLSSAGHKFGDVDFDDPHFDRRPYEKWVAYGQSKTANVLFSVELSKRLAPHGITANAVHPGGIQTELGRHLTEEDREVLMARVAETPGGFTFKPVEAGAATSVWAATAAELEGRGGLYLEDCHVAEEQPAPAAGEAGNPTLAGGYLGYARDPSSAARLWSLSEELLGESFSP
jgi:NAD(P)-dependent dehydrogenase (short-subunit alcohol dehydrogenase family)